MAFGTRPLRPPIGLRPRPPMLPMHWTALQQPSLVCWVDPSRKSRNVTDLAQVLWSATTVALQYLQFSFSYEILP